MADAGAAAMTEAPITVAVIWIVPLVIAIVFHEVAHGLVARHFGDMTAARLGRLSLNPLRHIDPFGTVILPLILAVSGAPIFGWAKPVPVVSRRMRNPVRDMMFVALAGPATNVLLALVSALGLAIFGAGGIVGAVLWASISINCFLAVFNMIPLPPFDGSRVVRVLMPDALRRRWDRLDRYALPIFLALLVLAPMLGPKGDVIGGVIIPIVDGLRTVLLGLFGLVRVP